MNNSGGESSTITESSGAETFFTTVPRETSSRIASADSSVMSTLGTVKTSTLGPSVKLEAGIDALHNL